MQTHNVLAFGMAAKSKFLQHEKFLLRMKINSELHENWYKNLHENQIAAPNKTFLKKHAMVAEFPPSLLNPIIPLFANLNQH